MLKFNPNHVPSGGPGGGQFAPGGGGGGNGGVGSGGSSSSGSVIAPGASIRGRVADIKKWANGKSAKEVIAAAVANHKLQETAKEGELYTCQTQRGLIQGFQ